MITGAAVTVCERRVVLMGRVGAFLVGTPVLIGRVGRRCGGRGLPRLWVVTGRGAGVVGGVGGRSVPRGYRVVVVALLVRVDRSR